MALNDIVFTEGDLQNFEVIIPAGTLPASTRIVTSYPANDTFVSMLVLVAGSAATCWAY